jgi:hypothetical protein
VQLFAKAFRHCSNKRGTSDNAIYTQHIVEITDINERMYRDCQLDGILGSKFPHYEEGRSR